MTAKLRKDLDTISDKTGIPMKSCLRQYDNIKRIYKVIISYCVGFAVAQLFHETR